MNCLLSSVLISFFISIFSEIGAYHFQTVARFLHAFELLYYFLLMLTLVRLDIEQS